jgi:hypothetical protein
MPKIPAHVSRDDIAAARSKIRTTEIVTGDIMTAAMRSTLLGEVFPTWSIEYRRDIVAATFIAEAEQIEADVDARLRPDRRRE